jgi:DNA-binding response OmpR family regulator
MSARVLVIDDSPVTVELITDALSAAGIGADSASDLASLDLRLSANRYELMLVDVNMPEMYGDDVVEFLRAQRRLTARLYLYSDLSETELTQKALASGADGFITKASGLPNAVEVVRAALAALPSRPRVLLVDAAPGALAKELASAGLDVLTAGSVEDATKVILKKRTRPDLVLLARETPSAEELIRFIKANSLFAHIRVVVCAAAGREAEPLTGADAALPNDSGLGARIISLLVDTCG